MMEFEKQTEIMDMKEEMMNDAIDDAMGDDDDEEERYYMLTIEPGDVTSASTSTKLSYLVPTSLTLNQSTVITDFYRIRRTIVSNTFSNCVTW